MKTAWLLHGTGGSDTDYFWFEDTKKYMAEKLGAKFIFAKGQGHIGSGTYSQPYREFPELKDLISG